MRFSLNCLYALDLVDAFLPPLLPLFFPSPRTVLVKEDRQASAEDQPDPLAELLCKIGSVLLHRLGRSHALGDFAAHRG